MPDSASKLFLCFSNALGLPIASIHDSLAYSSVPEWDSVAHMALVAELEQEYGVMFDTDEIIAMNSVAKARQMLEIHGIKIID
jgi:acyl carrier protein